MNSVPDADNRYDAVTKANSIIEAVGFVPADGEVRETHLGCGFIDDMVTSLQREVRLFCMSGTYSHFKSSARPLDDFNI